MKKLLSVLIAITVITAIFAVPTAAAPGDVTLTATPADSVQFPGSANTAWLCDGNIPETVTDYTNPGIVIVCNKVCTDGNENPEGSIVVELPAVQDVEEINVTWYHQYSAMIGLPKDNIALVAASADGTTWSEEKVMDIVGEAVDGQVGQITSSVKLDTPVYDAKYIRVNWNYGPSPFADKVVWEWVGLTEIGAKAPEATVAPEKPGNIDTSLIPEGAATITGTQFDAWNTAGLCTVERAIDNIKNHNPLGCTAVILRPTDKDGVYKVVEVYAALEATIADDFFTYEKGDIALLMSAGNAAWDALNAMEADNEVTFLGYDIVNGLQADNATIYFTSNYVAPPEVSDDESDEESVPVESTPVEDESEPADDSKPADDKSEAPAESTADESKPAEKKGCGSSIAVTAVVVTSILGLAIGFTRRKK